MLLYSIELDLAGKTALVVGLGPVGRRKAASLVEAGARVVGVDPAGVAPPLPGVETHARPYRAEDLEGVALACAAGPPEVNRRVVADARAAGVWVNSASEPAAGDFLVPAVWRDGPVKVAVSTSGAGPALAAALRDRAARSLGAGAARLAELTAELRPEVLAGVADPEGRRRIFAEWADLRWLDRIEADGLDAVREALRGRIGEILGPDRRGE